MARQRFAKSGAPHSRSIMFRNTVIRNERDRRIFCDAISHIICVFTGVIIMVAKHRDGPESVVGKKQLRGNVGFTYLQNDFATPLLRQFVDQALNHLSTNAVASGFGSDCKIQNSQYGFVQFIDHGPHNFVIEFSHGTDAVSLPKTTEKFLFGPWELKTVSLDGQDFIHIPSDQPANLSPRGVSDRKIRICSGLLICSLESHCGLHADEKVNKKYVRYDAASSTCD